MVNDFQRMDHFYWSLQSWLTYRFDALSAVSILVLTVVALYTNVSAGLTAFVLIAASQLVESTHALCKQYGQLEMDFTSVERLVEMLHIDHEPKGTIKPPASWPLYTGDIVFDNVSIRYAPDLDPALSDLSFTIKGGSSTAIIGRTGSGKSTLALALLATIQAESGSITIDGIDISKVDTQALRTRVTFLAQDPVLFAGTMRLNLDPLEEYTDEVCASVLQKVCEGHDWTLATYVDGGGRNLSQGQRQLIGLARAILRRSAIVILDEVSQEQKFGKQSTPLILLQATASIDMHTALRVQEILRDELRESTLVTIAHRVEAVKSADNFIVLDKGRLYQRGAVGDILKD